MAVPAVPEKVHFIVEFSGHPEVSPMTVGSLKPGRSLLLAVLLLTGLCVSLPAVQRGPAGSIPRLPDGKPDIQGIWQSDGKANADVQPFVEGGAIPYKPEAQAKKSENQKNRATA